MKRTELLRILTLALMPRLLDRKETVEHVGGLENFERLKGEFGLLPSAQNGAGRTQRDYYDIEAVERAVDAMTAKAYAAEAQS
jgi:hypothetical protein